ncbi:MAG: hypothetical protein NTW21_38805 [Verrucomicrobia bacterium]|nr:hypothetical protein [Verrucomicrobiota bacterium]
MHESLLDECPGMSPRRKQLLLEKFGSVARLKTPASRSPPQCPASRRNPPPSSSSSSGTAGEAGAVRLSDGGRVVEVS